MLLSSQRVSCRTVDASHSGKGVAYMRTPSRTTRFASLLQRNLDRFRRYAHNLRNGKEISRTAETMDAIQDASVDFLRRPRKIKSTTHFNNLFKGFIRNALGDRRKKDNALKRGGGAVFQKIETLGEIEPDRATGPGTAAVKKELNCRLKDALPHLGPADRKIIDLRICDKRSWAEIASQLGYPSAGAARQRYNRALGRLKEVMPEP